MQKLNSKLYKGVHGIFENNGGRGDGISSLLTSTPANKSTCYEKFILLNNMFNYWHLRSHLTDTNLKSFSLVENEKYRSLQN